MTKFRPGQHVYVSRIGNVSIVEIKDDGSALVNPLAGPHSVLTIHDLKNAELLPATPVPLFWDRPVYAQDGRRFIFNDKGYGRTVEHHDNGHRGRQMWYGWLGDYPQAGNWYYEDGTPARSTDDVVNLTNVPPKAKVGDQVVYLYATSDTDSQASGWHGCRATVVGVYGPTATVLREGHAEPESCTLQHLHPVYDAAPLLDQTDTIIARADGKEDREFKVLGMFSPFDGKGPDQIAGYVVNGYSHDGDYILFVNPLTGRAVPRYENDRLASNVQFVRKPNERTYGDVLQASGTGVNVTEVDGVVTDVRLV